MKAKLAAWLYAYLTRKVAHARPADFVIGGAERPYLLRWWLTPWTSFYRNHPADKPWTLWHEFWTRLPGVYLHLFLRSDDDRALHDHPWANISFLISGEYTEHLILAGGIHKKTVHRAGDIRIRWSGKEAHRIELHDGPCWTIFITGFRYRSWGFLCENGWRPWREFVAPHDKGSVGRGCD